jgi:hypothetical protein
MGDARGRWEGDVLVVETTNFKPEFVSTSSAVRNAIRGVDSTVLRLIERFRPLGPTTLEWAVTVDDPSTWVAPWTFAMNLTRTDDSQQPYEYACHEGNYGLRNLLGTARASCGVTDEVRPPPRHAWVRRAGESASRRYPHASRFRIVGNAV